MSTPRTLPPRALFTGLVDDAAVFPPGNASLPDAIARRERRRGATYADLVGPLLLPTDLVNEAVSGASPLTIAVVGRPGADLGRLLSAAHLLADAEGHSLAGIELGHGPHWRDALDLGVPLAVEVSPDEAGLAALEDLSELADGQQVRAKLRTGSTERTPVPTVHQLAAFVVATVQHGIAFKLTGGLHHAVAHTASTPAGDEEQHGVLNVLLATHRALQGDTASEVGTVLAQRDSAELADQVRALDDTAVRAVRDQFHSYGCCDVLDPIRDLADLRLIEETRP
ncbi:hypothetical protein PZ938_19545 [Luteipulveratus sp. YIM 133132]|uniref:hypothetical protein n=1 Tax=Luteipulveratus flavus TaxID=3031728 RepID=UPI0023B0ED8F|nr:hypothetical protein [Luteipulveratus sp. YIM 133132]MDE9367818.1 hypothetical protein [Luteipulveratus sp. YIM 133132]